MGSAGATLSTGHRVFLYYSSDNTTKLQFARPGFYEMNGHHPTINELVNPGGYSHQGTTANRTFAGNINIADSNKLNLGAGNDLQIYHVADSNSYIEEHGAGALVFKSNDYYFQSTAAATVLQVIPGSGIVVTGNLTVNTADAQTSLTVTDAGTNAMQIKVGAGDEIYFGSNNTYQIQCNTSGNVNTQGIWTFVNSVLIPNKLEHSGDSNTYLSFSANDHIELTAGGHEFLAIDGTNFNATPSGVFTIDAGGQVNIDSGNAEIHLKGSGTTFGKFYTSGGDFYINHPTSDEDIIIRGNDGGSGINALTFDMSDGGRAVFNNDVVAFSDERLKKNIKTLDGSKVYDMRGVSFTRKDTDKKGSGVIAQEIQKIAPELISETDGTLGVSYGNITGYLIEAIKDLKAEVEELKQCNKCEDCNCKNK